jgi:hypothetical protein
MNLLLSQSTEVSRTVENDEVFRKGPVPWNWSITHNKEYKNFSKFQQ